MGWWLFNDEIPKVPLHLTVKTRWTQGPFKCALYILEMQLTQFLLWGPNWHFANTLGTIHRKKKQLYLGLNLDYRTKKWQILRNGTRLNSNPISVYIVSSELDNLLPVARDQNSTCYMFEVHVSCSCKWPWWYYALFLIFPHL